MFIHMLIIFLKALYLCDLIKMLHLVVTDSHVMDIANIPIVHRIKYITSLFIMGKPSQC